MTAAQSCPITPNKRAFATEEAAAHAAEHINQSRRDQPGHRQLEPYPCLSKACGRWHMRSRKTHPGRMAKLRERNPEKYREIQRAAQQRYRANVAARESLSVQGQGCT